MQIKIRKILALIMAVLLCFSENSVTLFAKTSFPSSTKSIYGNQKKDLKTPGEGEKKQEKREQEKKQEDTKKSIQGIFKKEGRKREDSITKQKIAPSENLQIQATTINDVIEQYSDWESLKNRIRNLTQNQTLICQITNHLKADSQIVVPKGATVILEPFGKSIRIVRDIKKNTLSLFHVESNGKLIIRGSGNFTLALDGGCQVNPQTGESATVSEDDIPFLHSMIGVSGEDLNQGVLGGQLDLETGSILRNGVSSRGAAILSYTGSIVNIRGNAQIIQCSSYITPENTSGVGGGIQNAGMLNLEGGIIKHCFTIRKGTDSGGTGGAIYNSGIVNMGRLGVTTGPIIENCVSSSSGSAIQNAGGSIFMYGGEIRKNIAGVRGAIGNVGRFEMYGGKISGNKNLGGIGSAIINNGGTIIISGGEICENYGTQIYSVKSQKSMAYTKISNSAKIHSQNSSFTVNSKETHSNLRNGVGCKLIIENGNFTNAYGSCIYNEGETTISEGKFSTGEGNSSNQYGTGIVNLGTLYGNGGIYYGNFCGIDNYGIAFLNGITLYDNDAYGIYNQNQGIIQEIKDSIFGIIWWKNLENYKDWISSKEFASTSSVAEIFNEGKIYQLDGCVIETNRVGIYNVGMIESSRQKKENILIGLNPTWRIIFNKGTLTLENTRFYGQMLNAVYNQGTFSGTNLFIFGSYKREYVPSVANQVAHARVVSISKVAKNITESAIHNAKGTLSIQGGSICNATEHGIYNQGTLSYSNIPVYANGKYGIYNQGVIEKLWYARLGILGWNGLENYQDTLDDTNVSYNQLGALYNQGMIQNINGGVFAGGNSVSIENAKNGIMIQSAGGMILLGYDSSETEILRNHGSMNMKKLSLYGKAKRGIYNTGDFLSNDLFIDGSYGYRLKKVDSDNSYAGMVNNTKDKIALGVYNTKNFTFSGGNIQFVTQGIENSGVFIHTAGVIKENTGYGVIQKGIYRMSGKAKVALENPVYLYEGKVITVDGMLEEGHDYVASVYPKDCFLGRKVVTISYENGKALDYFQVQGSEIGACSRFTTHQNYVLRPNTNMDKQMLQQEGISNITEKDIVLSEKYVVKFMKNAPDGYDASRVIEMPVPVTMTKYWCENLKIKSQNIPKLKRLPEDVVPVDKIYECSSWNTKRNGTGTSYGVNVATEYKENEDLILYTIFTKKSFQIEFVAVLGVPVYTNQEKNTYTMNYNKTLYPDVIEDRFLTVFCSYGDAIPWTYGNHTTHQGKESHVGSSGVYRFSESYLEEALNQGKVTYKIYLPRKQYTIKYDGNGSTQGIVQDSLHFYNLKRLLNKNTYVQKYHMIFYGNGGNVREKEQIYGEIYKQPLKSDFLYWNLPGKGTYTDLQQVENLTNIQKEKLTLYAQWKIKGRKLLGVTQRRGYDFIGWDDTSTYEKETLKEGKMYIPSEAKDYYFEASWREQEFTILYDANGGIGTAVKEIKKYFTDYTIKENMYENQGYQFFGWSLRKNLNPLEENLELEYQPGKILDESLVNESHPCITEERTLILYAIWIPIVKIAYINPIQAAKADFGAVYEIFGENMIEGGVEETEINLLEPYQMYDNGTLEKVETSNEKKNFLMEGRYEYFDSNEQKRTQNVTATVTSWSFQMEPSENLEDCYHLGEEITDAKELYQKALFLGEDCITKNRPRLEYYGTISQEEWLKKEEEQGFYLNLFSVYDYGPKIHGNDLYYSLQAANEGEITMEELLSQVEILDSEDGNFLKTDQIPNVEHRQEDTVYYTVLDYQLQDFTQLTADAQVSVTYLAIDSAGNKTKQKINVTIVDTSIKEEDFSKGETRFINYSNLWTLDTDSVWLTEPYFSDLVSSIYYAPVEIQIQENYPGIYNSSTESRALQQIEVSMTEEVPIFKDHFQKEIQGSRKYHRPPMQVWIFSKEEVQNIKDFIETRGITPYPEPTFFEEFLRTFDQCYDYENGTFRHSQMELETDFYKEWFQVL